MGFEDTLLALEFELWNAMTAFTDREAYFRERLTEDGGLTVMEPLCMMTRDECLKEAAAAPPVVEFTIDDARVVRLTEDSGIVVYMMTHRREGGPTLVGGVASVYVRREDKWWLAYHQVTPYGNG